MKHDKLFVVRRFVYSSSSLLHYQKKSTVSQYHIFPPKVDDYVSNPTSSSLSSSLQHYISSDFPFHGIKIHTHILKIGFKPNTNISIKLLIIHLKSNSLSYARNLFDEINQPTLSAYNYMISGYLKHNQIEDLLGMFRSLTFSYEMPDGFTFSMILKASTCLPAKAGQEVHAQIFKSNVELDEILSTSLVDSYVKHGKVDYARRVFDVMLEKNVVCSTSMISGYMKKGCVDEAEDLFMKTAMKDVVVFNAMIEGYSTSIETAEKSIEVYIEMQRLNFKPNMSTFVSVIGACSILSALEVGQQIQAQLTKTNFFFDVKMGSALTDMYSKCGRIEDARRIFDNMPQRNVFSWTSMIDGYGKNGYPFEAINLFRKMGKENCIKPNYITFLSALSACGHAGFIDTGQEIFDSMEMQFCLKPKMEHYACMVDLLGRAGCLSRAREFVMGMPERPNSDVWAALLSSCRLHGEVEMANWAANEIFKLSVDERPGAYVVLSNTLAEAGKWESVSEIRELMKVRGVAKDTACSWVGNENGLEGFHVGQKL